jgi:hypothetical protein
MCCVLLTGHATCASRTAVLVHNSATAVSAPVKKQNWHRKSTHLGWVAGKTSGRSKRSLRTAGRAVRSAALGAPPRTLC